MRDWLDITIIHGSGSNPGANWFPWLATELRTRGNAVRVPQFPDQARQSLSSWMECFEENAQPLGMSSLLIGHSTGVALTLNLLNNLTAPVAGVFLVGGFFGKIGSPIYDPLNESFFAADFDWKRIRKNAGELFVYAGDNDPYVPLATSVQLARLLKSELILLPDGGHLNHESNFFTFERLLKDFDRWRDG